MDSRALETLEFPRVLDRLAGHTGFSLGRERALALRPVGDRVEIERRQRLTREARRLIELRTSVTIGGARDVRDHVRRCALGGQLDPSDLREVGATLEAGRNLRRQIAAHREHVAHLAELADGIPDLRAIEENIDAAINDNAEVVDHASPTLARIRHELKTAHSRLLDRLNGILTSSAYRDVIQDAIITVRDGRYVIPIKAEARSKFRSIVHDQSASGATLFVEPLLTVDLNNRWRELQLDEAREVKRILLELSRQVGDRAEDILFGIERLADLDLVLAAARYAAELAAVEPTLVDGQGTDAPAEVRLRDARHPLLSGLVVPITIRIGGDVTILLITGPNTGGKTVALKTAGLLTLMAQAGLQIPTAEGSAVRIVDAVFADIGDEQSIAQSLSTFSSHLTNIIAILRQATGRSLVLLDELGAGTDPAEGSALARAILSELLDRGTLVIGTTHFAELKTFAHMTAGVANASVEFDVESLSPTYRLSIGLPGRSNALAIATRLGLPDAILARARAMLSEGDVRVETILADIQSERGRAEAARRAAEREHRRVADLARQLSGRLAAIEREKHAAVESARAQAEAELADVRERLREVAARVERGEIERRAITPLIAEVRTAQRKLAERRPAPAPTPTPDIKVGGWVRLKRLGQIGQVIALADDGVDLQIGSFKTRARFGDVEPVTRAEREAQDREASSAYSMPRHTGPMPQTQIEIRGWRADQVVPELDKYLNDAYMAGLPMIRIVHGKGTGVLRQIVREHLAHHPLVDSFQSADRRDGGDGVTVAALAG